MKQSSENPSEPKYGLVDAAMVPLFRPVMAVRRADHLTMWRAWIVHCTGLVMIVVVILLLIGYESQGRHATFVGGVSKTMEIVGELIRETDEPAEWAGLIAGILLIEACVWLAAVAGMSWCAREEKFRHSHQRALRRLWLLTPHAATVIGVVGVALIYIERSQWMTHRNVHPINYGVPLISLIVAAGCFWSLWVLLKALGCRPSPAMCRWPARCENCGYQLAGLSHRLDCPECGREIYKTLYRSPRLGGITVKGLGDWLRVSCQSIRRPTALGQRIQVMSSDTSHQKCLAISLSMVAVTIPSAAAGAVIMDYLLSEHMNILDRGWGEAVIVASALGTMMVGTTALVVLGIAGLTGMIAGWHRKRNMMPASIRVACYQSGFAVLWALVFWFSMGLFVVVMELDLLSPISAKYNIASEKLVFAWHYAVVGTGLIIYGILVERATKATKHANW